MQKKLWEDCKEYQGRPFSDNGFNGCWSCENLCKETGEFTNGIKHIAFCGKALKEMKAVKVS